MSTEIRIVEQRANRYLVETVQRGGETHDWWVDPNGLRCECPAGRRGRRCKHLRAVIDHLEGRLS